jgi:hypothetical protein
VKNVPVLSVQNIGTQITWSKNVSSAAKRLLSHVMPIRHNSAQIAMILW